jgi:hypothetical protein
MSKRVTPLTTPRSGTLRSSSKTVRTPTPKDIQASDADDHERIRRMLLQQAVRHRASILSQDEKQRLPTSYLPGMTDYLLFNSLLDCATRVVCESWKNFCEHTADAAIKKHERKRGKLETPA